MSVTLSLVSKALNALADEHYKLVEEAQELNLLIDQTVFKHYKELSDLSTKHIMILRKMGDIDEAIEKTKELVRKGCDTYTSKG